MANEHIGMEEEPEIIYIPDDEGNEEEFEVIMKFEVDGSDAKYMMVVPRSLPTKRQTRSTPSVMRKTETT